EDAYWKTITNDLCGQPQNHNTDRFRRQIEGDEAEYVEWLRDGTQKDVYRWWSNPNWQCLPGTEPFLLALLRLMQEPGATLIVTSRGYFGVALGKSEIIIGDEVYILGGGRL